MTRVPNEDTPPPPPMPERAPGRQARPTGGTSTGTASSRLALRRPAIRKAALARLALSGASGSGKTWTALGIATRLTAGHPDAVILVIDTEPGDGRQGAAELYADRFRFDTIEWHPPYDPRDLALTIREAYPVLPEHSVVIIDSASHFWRGEGGTLDIAGGRFAGWKTATPIQDDLVDAILRAPFHVIVCTRAKQDYAQQLGADGRQEVVKLGLAPIQRDDLEYEFQVVVMMDQQHVMEVGKTRAAPLAGRKYAANHQGEFAEAYAAWLEEGVALARMQDIDEVRRAVASVHDANRRAALKREFKGRFGDPESLTHDALPAVHDWLKANGLPEEGPTPEENLAGARAELAALAAAEARNTPAERAAAQRAAEDQAAATAIAAAEHGTTELEEARLAAEAAARRVAEAEARQAAAQAALEEAEREAAAAGPDDADGAEGGIHGATSALELADAELDEARKAATVETLRTRVAALEGRATGTAPPPAPDDEAAVIMADEARWRDVWQECSAMRLVELAERAGELGLAQGGNKAALVDRVARHLFAQGYQPAPVAP